MGLSLPLALKNAIIETMKFMTIYEKWKSDVIRVYCPDGRIFEVGYGMVWEITKEGKKVIHERPKEQSREVREGYW